MYTSIYVYVYVYSIQLLSINCVQLFHISLLEWNSTQSTKCTHAFNECRSSQNRVFVMIETTFAIRLRSQFYAIETFKNHTDSTLIVEAVFSLVKYQVMNLRYMIFQYGKTKIISASIGTRDDSK